MDRKHLFFVTELGQGWFGPVITGECTRYGETLRSAVTVRMLSEDKSSQRNKIYFLADIQAYKECADPCVLKLIGICADREPFYAVLEQTFTDLKSYLQSIKDSSLTVDEAVRVKFASQISRGLSVLHEKGFVYQDLGARNCWLSDRFNIKLGDYGNPQDLHADDYVSVGGDFVPLRWLAPELVPTAAQGSALRVENATRSSNLWALGVVFIEICSWGDLPYADISDSDLLLNLKKLLSLEELLKSLKPVSSDNLLEFAKLLLKELPESRASASTISSRADDLFKRESAVSDLDGSWDEYMQTIVHSVSGTGSLQTNPVIN